MTLIVGILCGDGIVLAADSAATYGAMGVETMWQPMTKLSVLGSDTVIAGVSGTTGLAQRYEGEITRLVEGGKLKNFQPDQVMRMIQEAIVPIIRGEFQMAAAAAPVIGAGIAATSALSGVLVAMNVPKEGPYLFRFDQQGSPEFATPELPFASVGKGYIQADPFFAFIKRLFWPKGLPTVVDGVLAAVWTLRHAILTVPGGVIGPIRVATLHKGRAKKLDEAELQEHQRAIQDLEKEFANVKARFTAQAAAAEAPPAPPA